MAIIGPRSPAGPAQVLPSGSGRPPALGPPLRSPSAGTASPVPRETGPAAVFATPPHVPAITSSGDAQGRSPRPTHALPPVTFPGSPQPADSPEGTVKFFYLPSGHMLQLSLPAGVQQAVGVFRMTPEISLRAVLGCAVARRRVGAPQGGRVQGGGVAKYRTLPLGPRKACVCVSGVRAIGNTRRSSTPSSSRCTVTGWMTLNRSTLGQKRS